MDKAVAAIDRAAQDPPDGASPGSRMNWRTRLSYRVSRREAEGLIGGAGAGRPAADGPELAGVYEKEVPVRGRSVWFRYDVVRVWELPPERLLTAGLPLVPLAPVSAVAPERLPEVLTAVAQRLRDEAAPEVIRTLWIATTILTGLRYPREQIGGLIEEVATMVLGIRGLEESWVYQDILTKGLTQGRAEGGLEEARRILLGLGRKKLGQPDQQVLARMVGLTDLECLNLLLERLLDASSWEELLAASES